MNKLFSNKYKLKNLKNKARLLRIKIETNFLGDAGSSLSEYLNPMIKEKEEFNRVMDKISKIDPDSPKFRYEV